MTSFYCRNHFDVFSQLLQMINLPELIFKLIRILDDAIWQLPLNLQLYWLIFWLKEVLACWDAFSVSFTGSDAIELRSANLHKMTRINQCIGSANFKPFKLALLEQTSWNPFAIPSAHRYSDRSPEFPARPFCDDQCDCTPLDELWSQRCWLEHQ